MADVTPDPRASASVDPLAVGGPADDPFLRLHKMSTTAGVGSGDYVAINGTAIAAVLLGVASALVLFNDLILILIPIAGVICAVLALRQVAVSNGTQAGREIAWLGLLLALAFGGYFAVTGTIAYVHDRADRNRVVDLIRQFGDDVRDSRYDAAYALCTPGFQSHNSRGAFESRWRQQHESALLGSLSGMDWNQLLSFQTDATTGDRQAVGMVLIRYSRSSQPFRVDMEFRKLDNRWQVDLIPEIFPLPTAPKGPKAGAKGGVLGPPKPIAPPA